MRVMREVGPSEPWEGGGSGGPTIVVEFHVPGEVLDVEFSGLRTGSFFRRERAQVVQVAVPADIAESAHPDAFIFAAMRDALEIGRRRLAKKGVEYPISAALELLGRIEAAVSRDSPTNSPPGG